ncbi:MAG TPA: serine protease [Candidatus Saccharimonadales bacterium]|nr:serine protease [Candidatus Saccharimonadales bacterium]
MSEFNSGLVFDRLYRKREIAAFLAGLAVLGGSGKVLAGQASAASVKTAGLERCYDQPDSSYPSIPKVPKKISAYMAWDKKWGKLLDRSTNEMLANNEQINLRAGSHGLVGDPGNLQPAIDWQVESAAVRIDGPVYEGSGFLTYDAEGDEVAITAAHVIADEPIKKVIVRDSVGEGSHITGGCYMFESNHRFRALGAKINMTNHYIDVAVLRLSKNIGLSTLKLAAKEPKRGDWVFFKNFQELAKPKTPVTYAGLVSSYESYPPRMEVTTGLQYWRRGSDTIEAGASGGPVVNRLGEVVGTSVGGEYPFGLPYDSPGVLEALDSIRIKGIKTSHKTKLTPVDALVMPNALIREALASPRA